ncbi:MAG: class I SAM-dependent methyltransferase [Staphylococcus sp.]|nr:class I SAM-dependent methyltransferase [Staphylococcus sp.]
MKEDFNRLRLKYHGDTVMMDEILQRECRYKTSAKLPETLRCEAFRFPSLAVAEMATSDAVADIHAGMIHSGATVLDMTCGLGIDTFHFARKASRVTAVEIDASAYKTATENTKALGLGNVDIINADSIEWLQTGNLHFDYIFVDPARRNSAGRHFALRECSPDIVPALPMILSHCDRLVIKASPMIDIHSAVNELGCACNIAVIGTSRECKEVVFIIDTKSRENNSSSIRKVDCLTTGKTSFSYDPRFSDCREALYSIPQPGQYLYEPYPAVMKGGITGFKQLMAQYNVKKLHPNTHLFTTTLSLNSFPGEVFEILKIFPFSKQGIKALMNDYPVINVSTRNFPLSAPQLAAKLKVKEGGDRMVFGTTVSDGSRLLIVTTMGRPL